VVKNQKIHRINIKFNHFTHSAVQGRSIEYKLISNAQFNHQVIEASNQTSAILDLLPIICFQNAGKEQTGGESREVLAGRQPRC
jgi:hypothetical protein